MLEYLIICPLVFLAGFIDSIAGGGGLISLPAFLLAGVPAHTALGTNKLSSSMGTTISTVRFIKQGYLKRKELIKLAIISSITAIFGSTMGSNIALVVSEQIIENFLIVVLPVVAFYVLRNKNMGEHASGVETFTKVQYIAAISAAFFIGCYDGFYGPGTGTFLILVLTGIAQLKMKEAATLTKVINLSSNYAALTVFIINGTINYQMGIVAGLFCTAGHYLGSGMVVSNGKKIVRPVILLVIGILFVKIITGN